MTVAEMIAQRTAALRTVLNDCAIAVDAKGGTPADDLSGLQDAIASIPTGVVLPELTTPAEVGHVVAGKEYIDGNGDKRAGTLVVCDSIVEVEYFGIAGAGVSLDIESTADGSGKTMTLREPKLVAENIVVGSSIFGVPGTAKKLRVETGTITPAEDTKAITIPCTDGAKAFILEATDDVLSAVEGQSLIYAVAFAGNFLRKHNIEAAVNTAMTVWYKTQYASSGITAQNSGGVILSLNFNFYPGTYRWAAYYWEDDA